MMMINDNALSSVVPFTRSLVFSLVEDDIIDVQINYNDKRKKHSPVSYRSNSKAFYSITPKGIELYEKMRKLKELGINNFLVFEDYKPPSPDV
jgi:hypothetical protein